MTFSGGLITIEAIGLSVAIVDVVVVLYALIMACIGIKRGFVKMLFDLCGTLAIVVGAILLTPYLADFLVGPFGHFIETPVAEWMSNLSTESGLQIFTQPYNWGDAGTRSELLPIAITAMGAPSFVSGIITSTGLFNAFFEGVGEVALVEVLPAGISSLAFTIISFIILLIALAVVVSLLKKILSSLAEIKLFGAINKFVGFAMGLAQVYVIVSVVLTVVSYIPVAGLFEIIQSQIEISTVTKFLAENNFIGNWLVSSLLV